MNNVSMGNGDLMAKIGIDVMKKAMKVQEREVLSVLQSSTLQAPPQQQPVSNNQTIAELTGLGQKLDVKG